MAELDTRVRDPVTETLVAPFAKTETAPKTSPFAQAKPSPFIQASPFVSAAPLLSPFKVTAEATAAVRTESPFTVNRKVSPFARLERQLQRLFMVVPPRRPPSGRWWLSMQSWFNTDPDGGSDEYDGQLSVESVVNFDQANWNAEDTACRYGQEIPDHPACIAEVLEGGNIEAALLADRDIVVRVGAHWDRLMPLISDLRQRLAPDPEWLIDNLPGELTLRAVEWATDIGETIVMDGQTLRRYGCEQLEDLGFRDALLDAAVFCFPFCFDEGHELFEEISTIRRRGYFPYSPRQVLLFEDLTSTTQDDWGGAMGLLGQYKVVHTEYRSNFAEGFTPLPGVIGWRIHTMAPEQICIGGAC